MSKYKGFGPRSGTLFTLQIANIVMQNIKEQ